MEDVYSTAYQDPNFPPEINRFNGSWMRFATEKPNLARLCGIPRFIALTCIQVYIISRSFFENMWMASVNLGAFAFSEKYSFKMGLKSALIAAAWACALPVAIVSLPIQAIAIISITAIKPALAIERDYLL